MKDLFIISEIHRDGVSTCGCLMKIIEKTKIKGGTIAIITEFGRCRRFQDFHERISHLEEESEEAIAFSMGAMMLGALKSADFDFFNEMQPQLVQKGYWPKIFKFAETCEKKDCFQYVVDRLGRSTDREAISAYSQHLRRWLESDQVFSDVVVLEICCHMLVERARLLLQTYDAVVIVAGPTHLHTLYSCARKLDINVESIL